MQRYGFLTFRAHESETQVFEDFLTLIIPILHKMSPFVYHIEKDNTPARHIHAFFSLPSSVLDKNKIEQKIHTKAMKQLKVSCNDKQTVWTTALDVKLVGATDEDKLKTLGYTLKENVTRRQCIGFTEQECRQAIDFYAVDHRTKALAPVTEFTYATPKNIHSKMLTFMDEKSYDEPPSTILYEMRQSGVSFIQTTPSQRKESICEIKIYKKCDTELDRNYIGQRDSDNQIEIEDLAMAAHKDSEEFREYILYLKDLLKENGISHKSWSEIIN